MSYMQNSLLHSNNTNTHGVKNIVEFIKIKPLSTSHQYFILWGIDPLLVNDREINNETTAVSRQCPTRKWPGWKAVFVKTQQNKMT
jgi:hypothetical protein